MERRTPQQIRAEKAIRRSDGSDPLRKALSDEFGRERAVLLFPHGLPERRNMRPVCAGLEPEERQKSGKRAKRSGRIASENIFRPGRHMPVCRPYRAAGVGSAVHACMPPPADRPSGGFSVNTRLRPRGEVSLRLLRKHFLRECPEAAI